MVSIVSKFRKTTFAALDDNYFFMGMIAKLFQTYIKKYILFSNQNKIQTKNKYKL
jgi:hypothetical protein